MREAKTIVLNDAGRELTFRVRKMPCTKLESWMIRAGLLLAGTGMLDSRGMQDVQDGNVAGAAVSLFAQRGLGALAGLDYEKAKPLLDELMSCCEHVVDGRGTVLTPGIIDGIIEDVRTLLTLKVEAFKANFDFFGGANPSDSPTSGQGAEAAAARDSSKPKISVRSRHS